MKLIIGTLKLKAVTKRSTVYCYIPKKFKDILGEDILFNKRTLTFTRPNLDSKGIISIEHSYFYFYPEPYASVEEMSGTYNIVQKDEDTFKLKRKKDAVQ